MRTIPYKNRGLAMPTEALGPVRRKNHLKELIYITHYSSFHFLFHYPYITPIYYSSYSPHILYAGVWRLGYDERADEF